MKTIKARVNTRLLEKAGRFFTGALDGRIVEILQNARRAGATRMKITNKPGYVSIWDNGRGVNEFSKLLDMGGSGWAEPLEQSEDPAGVGFFCLAPRDVVIRSGGRQAVIGGDGWTGQPVEVRKDPRPVSGTLLQFEDDPWSLTDVEPNAVFTGLKVSVDGQWCDQAPFASKDAALCAGLGCRIEVREPSKADTWHEHWRYHRGYGNVLINFHGQVVVLDDHPVAGHDLVFLVDLTGDATALRLMLPARTRMVENEAFKQLHSVLELEAFRFLQRLGRHALPYEDYLRARKLGIELPEAEPQFHVGPLRNDRDIDPVEVKMPPDFPLIRCYRVPSSLVEDDDIAVANAHLLAALGQCETPFVPVTIPAQFDGYRWAALPTVEKVEVALGKELKRAWLWSGVIACVESIMITAHTSDGRVFTSRTCAAIQPPRAEDQINADALCVTPEAKERLLIREFMYHLGGYVEDGDRYDTQAALFEKDLDEFWISLMGPDEALRLEVLQGVQHLDSEWTYVTVLPNGEVRIGRTDGTERMLQPRKPGLS